MKWGKRDGRESPRLSLLNESGAESDKVLTWSDAAIADQSKQISYHLLPSKFTTVPVSQDHRLQILTALSSRDSPSPRSLEWFQGKCTDNPGL